MHGIAGTRARILSTMLLIGGLGAVALGQSGAADDPRAAAVDELFAPWEAPDAPGCAVGVVRDGLLIHKRGYGAANLDYGIPITPTTVFDVGSVSKQFTAAAALLLAEEGRLDLDEDIRTYLPEMPAYEAPITVRQLVHHTSGLRDYLTLMRLVGLRFEDVHPEEEILELLARQKNLNFRPGEEYLYSNSGYFLLAVIAKRVSGMPLGPFVMERIFRPLGMRQTRIFDDRTAIVPQRAVGYEPRPEGGFQVSYFPNFDVPGDGQVYTTVEDLLLWDRNFYTYQVGGRRFVELMQEPGTDNGGEPLDYAFGLVVGEHRGLKAIGHGGSWAGYRAQVLRFPDQRFSAIVLCNRSDSQPGRLARQVAEIYLAGAMTKAPSAAPRTVTLSEADLRAWVGTYRSRTDGRIWQVERENSALIVRTGRDDFHLAPLASDRFLAVDAPSGLEIRFARGSGPRLEARRDGQRPEAFERVTLVSPTLAELDAFTGDYYSEELDTTYGIRLEGGRLLLRRRGADDLTLSPTVADAFRAPDLTFTFTREGSGAVTGLTVGAGRVKNITFRRTG